jgi:predicted nucleotidyltransferase
MKEKKLHTILKLIIKEYNPKKVILFGSRGKGTNNFNSDYDIAIDSTKVDFRTKRKFSERIDEYIGLHKIDIVYLSEVEKSFRNIILKTGRVIYER